MTNVSHTHTVAQPLRFCYNHASTVRVDLDAASEPWWVAADVGAVLGYGKIAEILKRLDDDEKGIRRIDTLGGPQALWCVNEPGLYSLLLGSKKPEAKAFKRWVTHTVIPQIRRTGSYSVHHEMIAAYVAPQPGPRQAVFPREFYEHLYRLRGKAHDLPAGTRYHTWTANDIDLLIYRRHFHPQVMRLVRALNPRRPSGGRVRRHVQHLTAGMGVRELQRAIDVCLYLMRQASTMSHLLYLLDLVAPLRQHELPFREAFQGQLTRGNPEARHD